MSNDTRRFEYVEGDGVIAVKWERRDLAGKVIDSGVTGGKETWILHPKFSGQNIAKRVKGAAGLSWKAKTTRAEGDGDYNRTLEDGSTLHAYVMRGKSYNDSVNEMILDELLK